MIVPCWRCGHQQDVPRTVPFKETCEECFSYLHSCKGCRNYQPGMPNDCRIIGTDPITDREAGNLCDEFMPRLKPAQLQDDRTDSKKVFGDLFKD